MKFDGLARGVHAGLSHPSRGAWIEIIPPRRVHPDIARRTPHGVRGLKFGGVKDAISGVKVAPLTGCVD